MGKKLATNGIKRDSVRRKSSENWAQTQRKSGRERQSGSNAEKRRKARWRKAKASAKKGRWHDEAAESVCVCVSVRVWLCEFAQHFATLAGWQPPTFHNFHAAAVYVWGISIFSAFHGLFRRYFPPLLFLGFSLGASPRKHAFHSWQKVDLFWFLFIARGEGCQWTWMIAFT